METAKQVNLMGLATHDTRSSATTVKTVADDLGSVASRIRAQVDQFFERLSALSDRFKSGWDVTGNFAWRHQNCIESAISDRFIRICRQPNLRRSRNPTALPLVDRFGGLLEARARLYLYEDQQLTPARDDIDFTDRAAPAPRQNSKALGNQEGRGATLGGNSDTECSLPFRSREALRRRARFVTCRHQPHPWRD